MRERDLTDPMDALTEVGERLIHEREQQARHRRGLGRDDQCFIAHAEGCLKALNTALEVIADTMRDVLAAKAKAAEDGDG